MITDIDALHFRWLMSRFGEPSEGLQRLCLMLDENVFQRRVGNDINRAIDGQNLRNEFLDDYDAADIDPRNTNDFLSKACTWLEMLIALSESLDYLYEQGVQEHFIEILGNLDLTKIIFRTASRYDVIDQGIVDDATNRVDYNLFDENGYGGLFPLTKHDHPDQREVEIWDQQGAYFRERLDGVLWTSIS